MVPCKLTPDPHFASRKAKPATPWIATTRALVENAKQRVPRLRDLSDVALCNFLTDEEARWALRSRSIAPQPPTVGNSHSSAGAAMHCRNATAQPNGTRTSATGVMRKSRNNRRQSLSPMLRMRHQTLRLLNQRLNLQRLRRLRHRLRLPIDGSKGRRPSGGLHGKVEGWRPKWRVWMALFYLVFSDFNPIT